MKFRVFDTLLKCTAPIALAAISGCAMNKGDTPAPAAYTPPSITVDYGSPDFKIEPEENGQAFEGGFKDYRHVVAAAANKDRKALARLLYISAHAPFDAAGGEQQEGTMGQMLLRWGDWDFASVLAAQSPAVRKNALWIFKRESNRFEDIFPLTAKAALGD